MAIDLSLPRSERSRLPLGLDRVAAIPARIVLCVVVAASFLVRFAAALGHATPLYFPDEYIYGTLARSLAEHGRPLIRGHAAHFPALLQPILAAPFWLFHDPELAYRLTQAENALAMSLAAVPVYLLARRLELGHWVALVAGVLAVASPDLFFASFVLADPLAYPLALGAIYAAVCALSRPSWRSQLAFLALAGLATFARIQYALLPLVLLAAALIVERGRVRQVLRDFRLTVAILVAPVVLLLATGPSKALGYYNGIVDLNVRPGALAHWISTDAMLLVYCGGWVLVPGALVAIGYGLVRPRRLEESAFAAITVGVAVMLFAETSMYASNGSPRFQERYFMALLPLVLPWFGLWLKRQRPGRIAVAVIALALLVVSARVPLAPYSIAENKQDSPFLLGVFRLEKGIGVGTGSLAIALVAGVLSLVAIAVAYRARLATAAVLATLVIAGAASAGSVSFDHHVSAAVRASYVAPDARWIDHSGLRHVQLIHTPATPHARSHEQLFWNRSLDDVYFLDGATALDAFGSQRVRADARGRLGVGKKVLRGPLAISNFAIRARLRGAVYMKSGVNYDLWRPAGTPRLALFAGGLYHDAWLSQSGHVKLWPDGRRSLRGTLRLVLWLPKGTERTVLTLRAPGYSRRVAIVPAQPARTILVPVRGGAPWKLRFQTKRPGYLGDGRPISVKARMPVFVPTKVR
ncbi:MAG: glycosyltransferase family 39 protein [Actinomycetota bacterium]|nr:glycosyltransferase family 39 protein [Actinomycetota bacterium]